MTLQELIDELSGATDGAAEDLTRRREHPLFPEITVTRVTYKKAGERDIELSEQEVLIENIGTPEERAFYNKGRIPAVVIEASKEPFVPNATVEEIKSNIDTIFPDTKFFDLNIVEGREAATVSGMFYDPATGEASPTTYRVKKDDKGVFTAFIVKV